MSSADSLINNLEGSVYRVWTALVQDHNTVAADEQLKDIKKRLPFAISRMIESGPAVRARESHMKLWMILCGPLYRYPGKDDDDKNDNDDNRENEEQSDTAAVQRHNHPRPDFQAGQSQRKRVKREEETREDAEGEHAPGAGPSAGSPPSGRVDVCLLRSLEWIRDGAFSMVLPSSGSSDGANHPSSTASLGKMLTTCLSTFVQALESPLHISASSSQRRELWELGWGILSISDAVNQHKASQAESLALMRGLLQGTSSASSASAFSRTGNASYPRHSIPTNRSAGTAGPLSLPSRWSLPPALVQKTAACCLTLSQKKSTSSRVKSLALHLLGLLCEQHTEVMLEPLSSFSTRHSEARGAVVECFALVMEALSSARAADQVLAEGCMKGLSCYLNGFPLEHQVPDKLRALLGQFILAGLSLADTPENHNYQLPKAILTFLFQHADSPVLSPVLLQHAERLVELLERMWQHKNQAVRRLSVATVTAVTQSLALQLASSPSSAASVPDPSRTPMIVKGLVDHFVRPRLLASSHDPGAGMYSRRAVSFALVLSGHLARAIRCCMGVGEVDFLLRGLVAYVENWLSFPKNAEAANPQSSPPAPSELEEPANQNAGPPVPMTEPTTSSSSSSSSVNFLSDVVYFLAPFTSSLACLLLEVDEVVPAVIQTAKQLMDVMLQLLPEEAYFESLRQASSLAMRRLLVALQTCRRRLPSGSFLLSFACQRTLELASGGAGRRAAGAGGALSFLSMDARGALLGGGGGLELSEGDSGLEDDGGSEEEEDEEAFGFGSGGGLPPQPGLLGAADDEERRFERLERYAIFWKRVLQPEGVGAEELGYPFENDGGQQLVSALRQDLVRSCADFLCGLDLSVCLPGGRDGRFSSALRPAGLSDVLHPSSEVQPSAPADYEQFLRFVEFYYILSPSLWEVRSTHAEEDSETVMDLDVDNTKSEEEGEDEGEKQQHKRNLGGTQDWELLYQFLELVSQLVYRFPHVSGLLTVFYRTLLVAVALPLHLDDQGLLDWDDADNGAASVLPFIPPILSQQIRHLLSRCRSVCEKRMYIFADDLLYQCSMCVLVSQWWHSMLLLSASAAAPPHRRLGGTAAERVEEESSRENEAERAAEVFSVALQVILKGFHSAASDAALSVRLLEWRHENTRYAERLTEAFVHHHPSQAAGVLLPLLHSEWFYRFPRLTYLAACHGLALANAADASLQMRQSGGGKAGSGCSSGGEEDTPFFSSLSALETRGHPLALPLAQGKILRFPCGRLLRRVGHLCLHAGEPAARSTACELFHALVSWVIGESGTDGALAHWHDEVLDTVVIVAALGDNAVTRELFSDLLLQCVRWFAYQGASTGSREAEDGLQRLLFAKLWDDRAAVRQVAVSAFMERLQYVNRSRDTSSGTVDVWESGLSSFFSELRSQLLQSSSEARGRGAEVEGARIDEGAKRVSRAVGQLSCLSLLDQVLEHLITGREDSITETLACRTEAAEWLETLVTFLERVQSAGELDEDNGVLELFGKCVSRAAGLLIAASACTTSSRSSQGPSSLSLYAASTSTKSKPKEEDHQLGRDSSSYCSASALWQLSSRLLACFQWVVPVSVSSSATLGYRQRHPHRCADLETMSMASAASPCVISPPPVWLAALLKAFRAVEGEMLQQLLIRSAVPSSVECAADIGGDVTADNVMKEDNVGWKAMFDVFCCGKSEGAIRQQLQEWRQEQVRQLLWHVFNEEKSTTLEEGLALLKVLPSRLLFFQCVFSYDLATLSLSAACPSAGDRVSVEFIEDESASLFLPLLENLWAQLEAVLDFLMVGGNGFTSSDIFLTQSKIAATTTTTAETQEEEEQCAPSVAATPLAVCGGLRQRSISHAAALDSRLLRAGEAEEQITSLFRSMDVFIHYLLHVVAGLRAERTDASRCHHRWVARAMGVCRSLRVFPVKPWVRCLGALLFSFPFLSLSLSEQSPLGGSLWLGTTDLMESGTIGASSLPSSEEVLECYSRALIDTLADVVPPRFLTAFLCLPTSSSSSNETLPSVDKENGQDLTRLLFFTGEDEKWNNNHVGDGGGGGSDFEGKLALRSAIVLSSRMLRLRCTEAASVEGETAAAAAATATRGATNVWHAVLQRRSVGRTAAEALDERSLLRRLGQSFPPAGFPEGAHLNGEADDARREVDRPEIAAGWLEGAVLLLLRAGVRLSDILQSCVYVPQSRRHHHRTALGLGNEEEEDVEAEASEEAVEAERRGPYQQQTLQTQEDTVLRLCMAALSVFITEMELPQSVQSTSTTMHYSSCSPSKPCGVVWLEALLEDLCSLVQYPMMMMKGGTLGSNTPSSSLAVGDERRLQAVRMKPPTPLLSLDAAVSLAEHVMALLLSGEEVPLWRLAGEGSKREEAECERNEEWHHEGWVLQKPVYCFLESVLTTALPPVAGQNSSTTAATPSPGAEREGAITAKLRLIAALFPVSAEHTPRRRSRGVDRVVYELQVSLAPALAAVFRESCDWQRSQLLVSTSAVSLLTRSVYLYARTVAYLDAVCRREEHQSGGEGKQQASELPSVLLDAGEEILTLIVQYELPLHWREVLDLLVPNIVSTNPGQDRRRGGAGGLGAGYENYRQVLQALTLICGAVWKYRPAVVRQLLPLWAQTDFPHLNELCRFWSALMAEQCDAAAAEQEHKTQVRGKTSPDDHLATISDMDRALLALCHLGCEWQKQAGMPSAMWWAVSHQILFPVIRVLRPAARLEFFRVRLQELMNIASFASAAATCNIPSKMVLLLSKSDLRQATNALELLEIMCVHCSPDELRGGLNQAVLSPSEQPGSGKELIKKLIDLSRKGVELEAPPSTGVAGSAPSASCWLALHQAAHRCLIAIVTATQTQEMLFARLLFPAKGPKWWHHIVNLEWVHQPSENASSHGVWVSEEESKGEEGYVLTRRAMRTKGNRRSRAAATQFLFHDGESTRGSLPQSSQASAAGGPPSELTLTRLRSSTALLRQHSVTSLYHRSTSEVEVEMGTQALFSAAPLQRAASFETSQQGPTSTSMLLQDGVWRSTNTGELLRVVDLLIGRTPSQGPSGPSEDHSSPPPPPPEWVKGMISILTTAGMHLNVQLVMLRLFCLRSSFFRPYARQTKLHEAMLSVALSRSLSAGPPPAQTTMDDPAGEEDMDRLHYIARETIAVVLQWSQEDGWCLGASMTAITRAVMVRVLSETLLHFSSYASAIVPEEGWKALRSNLSLFRAVCEASDSTALQDVCRRTLFPKLVLPALRDPVAWRAAVQICGVLLQSTNSPAASPNETLCTSRSLAVLAGSSGGAGGGFEDPTFSQDAEGRLIVEAIYEELVRLLDNKGGASAEIIGLELHHLRAAESSSLTDSALSEMRSTLMAQSSQRLIGLYAMKPTIAIRAIRAVVEHEPTFLGEVVGTVLLTFSALDGDCQSLFLECLAASPGHAEATYDWVHAQFAGAWSRGEGWVRSLRRPLIQLLTVMVPQVTRIEDQEKMLVTFLSPSTMSALREEGNGTTLWAAYQLGLTIAKAPEWSTWSPFLSSFLLRSARQERNHVTIQDAVLKYADASAAPPDFFPRLLYLLRDTDNVEADRRGGGARVVGRSIAEDGEGWLRHTALLLLAVTRRDSSFSSRDFYFKKPLADGTIYVEKDVQSLSTRSTVGHRMQNTPLFYGRGTASQTATALSRGSGGNGTIAFAPSSQLYGKSSRVEPMTSSLPRSPASVSNGSLAQSAVFFTVPPPSFFYAGAGGQTIRGGRRTGHGIAGLVVPTGKALVQRQQQTQRQVTGGGRTYTFAASPAFSSTFVSASSMGGGGGGQGEGEGRRHPARRATGEFPPTSASATAHTQVSDATHSMIRAAAAKRRREAQKSVLQQWRAGLTPVTLYRRYQEGDFPDIQLPPEAFVTPLQALCLYDAGIAALVCSSVMEEVVQQEQAVAVHTAAAVTRASRHEGNGSANSNSEANQSASASLSGLAHPGKNVAATPVVFPRLAELTESMTTFLSRRLLFPLHTSSPQRREGHAVLLSRSQPVIFFMLELWHYLLSGPSANFSASGGGEVKEENRPGEDDHVRDHFSTALRYHMSLLESPAIPVSERTRGRWMGSAAEALERYIQRHGKTVTEHEGETRALLDTSSPAYQGILWIAQQLYRALQCSGEAALGLEAAARWMPRKAARLLRQGWQWEARGAYSDAERLYSSWLSHNPLSRTADDTTDDVEARKAAVESSERMWLAHQLVLQQQRDAAHKLMQWDELANSFDPLNGRDDATDFLALHAANLHFQPVPLAHLQRAAAMLRQGPSAWRQKRTLLLAPDADPLHRSSVSSFETFAALLALAPPIETITKVSAALPRLLGASSGGDQLQQEPQQAMDRFRLAFRLTLVLDASRVLQRWEEGRQSRIMQDEHEGLAASPDRILLSTLRRFVRSPRHYGWDSGPCRGVCPPSVSPSPLTSSTKTYRDGWLLDDLLLVHDILFTRLEKEGAETVPLGELNKLREESLANRLQACITAVSVLLDKPEGNGCAKSILRYATTRCKGSRQTLEALALRTRFFDLSFSAGARGGGVGSRVGVVEEALQRLQALRGSLPTRTTDDTLRLTADLCRAEVMLRVEAGAAGPMTATTTTAAGVPSNTASTPSSSSSSRAVSSITVEEGMRYGKVFFDTLRMDVESTESILAVFDAMLSHMANHASGSEAERHSAGCMDGLWMLYLQSLLCRLQHGVGGSGGGGMETARYIPRLWQALRRPCSRTDSQWLAVLEQLFHTVVPLSVWVPWTCQIVYTYIATRHVQLLSLLLRLLRYAPEACFYPAYAEQDSLREILEETLTEELEQHQHEPQQGLSAGHASSADAPVAVGTSSAGVDAIALLRQLLSLLGGTLLDASDTGVDVEGGEISREIMLYHQFGERLYHLHPPDLRSEEWESRVEVALQRYWKTSLSRDRAEAEQLFERWRRDTMDPSLWRRTEKVNHDFAVEAEKVLLPLLAKRVAPANPSGGGAARWCFCLTREADGPEQRNAAAMRWREFREESRSVRRNWLKSAAVMQARTKGTADVAEFSLSLHQLLQGQGRPVVRALPRATLMLSPLTSSTSCSLFSKMGTSVQHAVAAKAAHNAALALPIHPLSLLGGRRPMFFSGEYPEQAERVTGVSRVVRVLASKQQPKVVRLSTSSRATFRMLVKGGDDLRQDQRVQDLFHVFNLLAASGENARRTPAMLVRTYGVIPVSRWVGLVEFVPQTTTLDDLMLGSLQRELTQRGEVERAQRLERSVAGADALLAPQQVFTFPSVAPPEGLRSLPAYKEYMRMFPNPLAYLQSMISHRDEKGKRIPAVDMSKWFQELTNSITPTYLTEGLQRIAPFISDWHSVKHRFLHSHATLAILCYLFGIGDRHLSNHLVSVEDGALVGIDFGFAFDNAVRSQLIPELVPMRHTTQIRAVQGVLGDAVTHSHMTSAMHLIRQHRSVFDAVAAAFVDAPIGNEPQLLRTLGGGEAGRKRRSEWGQYKLRLLHWRLHDLHDPQDVLFHSVSQREDCKKNPDLLAGLKSLIYDTSGRRRKSGVVSSVWGDGEQNDDDDDDNHRENQDGGDKAAPQEQKSGTTREALDVSAYTHRLITLSTDPNLLSRMWIGWNSFL